MLTGLTTRRCRRYCSPAPPSPRPLQRREQQSPRELRLLKGLEFLALSHNPGLCGSFPRGLTEEYLAIYGYTNMMGPACGNSTADESSSRYTAQKMVGFCAGAALWLTCLCSCFYYNCCGQAYQRGIPPDKESNKEPPSASPPLAAPPPIDHHVRENKAALLTSWGLDEDGLSPSPAATTPAADNNESQDMAVDIDDIHPPREIIEVVHTTESGMELNGTKRNRRVIINKTELTETTGSPLSK
mmetsp:Transcript_4098/g.6984  ORF Transcript_4098/g.6984 Transcript_4098/m.6984 type:complete len:243 (+) Transcript_4098:64-792(+)